MIKITDVIKDSPAAKIGAMAGDILISLNDQKVNDFLDYQFFQTDEDLEIHVKRDEQDLYSPIEKGYDEDLGLIFDPPKIRGCANNCVFCFIDQNPKGMRKPIYFHDEDYRYSFLYGNFITLTNLRQKELDRIVTQRLSPLYISIHATDSEVRKKIFRYKGDDRLMEKINFLTDNEILIHAQIVLVPEMNDGEILQKTIDDLYTFKEQILSVAIVPVGMTKHRQNLPELKSIDHKFATNIVQESKRWNKNYKNIEGDPFITISDEFFILAEKELPSSDYYGPYYQIENGVGLTRELLDDFNYDKNEFPKNIKEPKSLLFLTGNLIKPLLEKEILPTLNKIDNLKCEFKAITNNFYGNKVTVSGLLTGQDIITQIANIAKNYDLIVLPPRCLNDDGIFLDDISPAEMEKQLEVPVFYPNNNFMEIIEYVSQ